MKNRPDRPVLRSILFLLFAISVLTAGITRAVRSGGASAYNEADKQRAGAEKSRALLQAGVGGEVVLATRGSGPGRIRASVESARDFILARSGLKLDDSVADKLAAIEARTLDGEAGRITCDDLADTVLATLAERFRKCTDSEIEEAADELSNVKTLKTSAGVQTPGGSAGNGSPQRSAVPATVETDDERSGPIMLRADGQGTVTRQDFIQTAKEFRLRMRAPAQLMPILAMVRPWIRKVFADRLHAISDGLPEQWGDAPGQGLTPVQSLLLTYSAVSDDNLFRSRDDLRRLMKWVEGVSRQSDASYPVADVRVPYGTQGYLFSTPLDLIFTRDTTNRLLDRLIERSSR